MTIIDLLLTLLVLQMAAASCVQVQEGRTRASHFHQIDSQQEALVLEAERAEFHTRPNSLILAKKMSVNIFFSECFC